MARVALENVSKIFQIDARTEVRAVQDVSLVVEEGELLVLAGPSGCGKSTVLRLIAGLEAASSGTISIGGEVVNAIPPEERDVAMVFQNYALYPHMTVRENLAFGLKLRKTPQAEIDRRVRETAERIGLSACLERLPEALSGGERQRVALGRALVRQPRVFLLDEPLSNLDAPLRLQLRREIGRLQARLGVTMIYVTHDQVEAMTMADRIAVMNAGAIQQVGRPLELYRSPSNLFVAGFIGSPPMNFLRGTIRPSGLGLGFETPTTGAPLSENRMRLAFGDEMVSTLQRRVGSTVVLGIRPEHLVVGPISQPCALAAPAGRMEAMVEAVEPLGADSLLHLAIGEQSLVARINSDAPLEVKERVWVWWDMKRVHVFDASTKEVIRV